MPRTKTSRRLAGDLGINGHPSHAVQLAELRRWLTSVQISRRLGVSRQCVRKKAERGLLSPAVCTPVGWLVCPRAVERWGRSRGGLPCPSCGRGLATLADLGDHFRREHQPGEEAA
jgi:hypothetical protein